MNKLQEKILKMVLKTNIKIAVRIFLTGLDITVIMILFVMLLVLPVK